MSSGFNFDIGPVKGPRDKLDPRPHLPDCASLPPKPQNKPTRACDCGRPNHPLPANRELYRDDNGRLRTRARRAWTTFRNRTTPQ